MTRNKKLVAILFLSAPLLGILYLFSPRHIEFLGHYDKVFAHRVNSVEKLKSSLRFFDGIELDLDYKESENILDVNHPPAESIGLTFEEYLSNIPDEVFPFLWLDIKALTAENAEAILARLNILLEAKHYPKGKVLVETMHPEALPIFTRAGFQTSYYLPGLSTLTPEDLARNIASITDVLAQQPSIGISTSAQNHGLIAAYFPERTKYIWYLKHPFDFEYRSVRSVLEDEKVAVVLTGYRSFSGNR